MPTLYVSKERCKWVGDNPLFIAYHDEEYGFEIYDDQSIFERLMLEIFQAGLSWNLVLEKRTGLNNAFYDFDPHKVAKMKDSELEELREDKQIIRNKLKIYATRNNAQTILRITSKNDSLLEYLRKLPHEVQTDPASELAEAVKIMKKDGFKFLGPTILNEFFLSIGLNEVQHDNQCFLSKNRS